jgi:proteic killer suppression protein
MIRSFRRKLTEALFYGACPAKFAPIRERAERKLAMLEAATSIGFLGAAPGNRLERLRGDRAGQWSVRISRRWRLCFKFEDGDAHDVEIVDYH